MGMPHPAQYLDPENVCFVAAVREHDGRPGLHGRITERYEGLCGKGLNVMQRNWSKKQSNVTCAHCQFYLAVAEANRIPKREPNLRARLTALLNAVENAGSAEPSGNR